MQQPVQTPRAVRFGVYEVDLRTGELRKQGLKMKLQEQPFQVLVMLLERPGEVVTREELRQRLWSEDTFVDFDHSLNKAINKIREALGDSADNSRFVETLARRGYRFIHPVSELIEASNSSSRMSQRTEEIRGVLAGGSGLASEALGDKGQAASAEDGSAQSGSASNRLRRTFQSLGWLLAAIAFLLALILVIGYFRHAPSELPLLKLSVVPPENAAFGASAISPDGRRLAFVAITGNNKRSLWVRPLDSLVAKALPDAEGADDPFWSPDSRSIGFFAQHKLKRIDLSGGLPRALCDVTEERGGTWNRDGLIVFAPNLLGPLYSVSATGGSPKPITTLDRSVGENAHFWPYFLPDGRHYFYLVRSSNPQNQGICVGSLGSKDRKRLLGESDHAAYAPPGYLLSTRDRTLLAQRFDLRHLNIIGEPMPLVEDVASYGGTGPSNFSISENGILIYLTSTGLRSRQLVWFDRTGKLLGAIAGVPTGYAAPRLSPDEKRVVWYNKGNIWLLELSRGIASRLTFDPPANFDPIWSPDGSRIAFASYRNGPGDLYLKALNSARGEELLLKSSARKVPTDWSWDGRFILYEVLDTSTNRSDLWMLPLFGERQPTPFVETPFDERQGQFSPDGRWVAYTSDESGRSEVYVQSFPVSGPKYQISKDGGRNPKWGRDGKELFYLSANYQLTMVEVVDVEAGSRFNAGLPKALFEPPVDPDTSWIPFTAALDKQRFLVSVGTTAPVALTVVQNWTAMLPK